jgi:hypothetical protein
VAFLNLLYLLCCCTNIPTVPSLHQMKASPNVSTLPSLKSVQAYL